MKEEIKNFFKSAEGIWIFGSFAEANYNNKSDIDIAVIDSVAGTGKTLIALVSALELYKKGKTSGDNLTAWSKALKASV